MIPSYAPLNIAHERFDRKKKGKEFGEILKLMRHTGPKEL
jgi:hypothetical protein